MMTVQSAWGAGPRQTRILSQPWCVAACAAALLHAGLWWGWQAVHQGNLPGHATHAVGRPSAQGASVQVRLMASLATPAGAQPEAALLEGAVSDALLRSLPPSAAGHTALKPAGRQGVAANYLPAETLSDSPRPDPGWLLDEEALSSVRHARLTMRLWVSAEGRIDRVALLSAEPAGDWVERAVQRLPETPMLPGLKDGRAVPSTLVVEIASEIERFR